MAEEVAEDAAVRPMYVTTFEGSIVAEMEGKLPAINLELPEGYLRGTHLRFTVEVRVKSVRHEENRHGDVVRQHMFALEAVDFVSAFPPEEIADSVGGSASATPPQTSEEAAELGLELRRSSDTWGPDRAAGF